VLTLAEAQKTLGLRERAQKNFMPFVHHVYDNFIEGRHHRIFAEKIEAVARGDLKRLIINLPPRHSKSEFASYLMPAWFIGRNPQLKIIQATHNLELAMRFGRKTRDLVNDPRYREIFPDTMLKEDSKAAGRWETSQGGEYFAAGVGSTVTGRGADLFIIDDPHALEINTLIPTPEGFVRIADIEVGGFVFGADGLPTQVLAKSKVVHDRELFSVVTDDQQEVLCDAAHLWSVRTDTKLSAGHRSMETSALADWDKASKPCLPRHEPVQYPEQDLPIDPWVLGAWLGDGTSSLGRMTCHPDDRAYMVESFEAAGYKTTKLKDEFSFGVLGLRAQLRDDLGVLNNKHIPCRYMEGSVAQRMALLQGLVDTDGSVLESGQIGFYNCNKGLVESVVELLHSLGVKATMRWYDDFRYNRTTPSRHVPGELTYFKTIKQCYRVMFRLQDAARMPRKQKNTYSPTDKRCRSIEVQSTGLKGSVQCITVENPDGLFLAGRGYVVTHNSEQDALSPDTSFANAYEWYTSGPRQRLQPGASIIVVQTRWGKKDLCGCLLKAQGADILADQWEVVEFPALMPSGNPLWPEFWDKASLLSIKASLPAAKWAAQWQQKPGSSDAAIIRREWWQNWEEDSVPNIQYIMQSYDTAFSAKETADYSAITTWGVFTPKAGEPPHLILLDARRGRWSFPDLRKEAVEENNYWEPDMIIIEARGSGQPLADELRKADLPVVTFSPSRKAGGGGMDKRTRMHMVSPLFEGGRVWAPLHKKFADEVIEEVATFGTGDNDDYCDSMTQALIRFRQGGFVLLDGEEDEEEMYERKRRRKYY